MIQLGADPEFFVRDTETGQVVPIIGLLGGTKTAPQPITEQDGFFVQEDNVMAEYNIPPCEPIIGPPGSSEFSKSVHYGREAAMDVIRMTNPNLEEDRRCARVFTTEQLQHPQAQTFGCSPDQNAYKFGQPAQVPPVDLRLHPRGEWRFAGGHIHIGGYDLDVPNFAIVQLLDLVLALPMIARSHDIQGARRRVYGHAGRYRDKPYGLEYRTLSNAWTFLGQGAILTRIEEPIYHLFEALTHEQDRMFAEHSKVPWTSVRQVIQLENPSRAEDLMYSCEAIRVIQTMASG